MKSDKKLKRLGGALVVAYKKRKKYSEEIKELERRIQLLKSRKQKCDKELEEAFDTSDTWLLSPGVKVTRKLITVNEVICTRKMVGTVLKSEFSYPRYNEEAVD